MAKRKRRTSIRTAAGTAQRQVRERLQELREDPMRVLPECPHGEPKAIAKVRKRLQKVAAGKAGFLEKRDKGIVGAVAHSLPLADREAFPRLVDAKVAGRRRFFLMRGNASRNAFLGVQNHDEPRALLMAYRDLAKKEGLHFFAQPGFWCTGETPRPPHRWLERLAEKAEAPLHEVEGGHAIGGPEGVRVRLRFRDGPFLDVAPDAVQQGMNMHQRVAASYASPRERHPVDVEVVLPDGNVTEPDRELVAAYRAGVKREEDLAEAALATWRKQTREEGTGIRYVLGSRDFGSDQEAFLDALHPEPWERDALREMTRQGFVGKAESVAEVLERQQEHLHAGVASILEGGGKGFLQRHRDQPIRDVLRLAHQEAEARQREAALPPVEGLGRDGQWIDGLCHTFRREGRRAAVDRIQDALQKDRLPNAHLYAFLQAVGGDMSLKGRFSNEDKRTAEGLLEPAKRVVESEGEQYVEALRRYVRHGGLES